MAKRKKTSQIDLPAMEGPGVASSPRISAIDRLADEYTEVRDRGEQMDIARFHWACAQELITAGIIKWESAK
jgi:hypothetical protein